jgi:DNA-binding response OmpR family regulator
MSSNTAMNRANILLIEDDASSGQAIKDLLEFLDYGVEWHRCAETVYDEFQASATRPDLIVLDLALGRVDGVTLIQRLRSEFETMPPVVVFSASPDAVLEQAVADTGAIGALRKPAGLLDLSRMLQSALDRPAKPRGDGRSRH